MHKEDWIEFSSSDKKYNISLSVVAFEQMKTMAYMSTKKETGGILIGSYDDEGNRAFITKVSSPPKDSRSSWASFLRGTLGLKKMLIEEWKAGNYYLGEWHLHPAGSPNPSSQDINQIKEISKDVKYKCPEPILIILAPHSTSSFAITIHINVKGQKTVRLTANK